MNSDVKALVIDDGFTSWSFGVEGLSTTQLHPEEVSGTHLESADILVVDFVLKDWVDRDVAPVCRAPADGLALAQVLRREVLKYTGPPKPIVILTQEPHLLSWPLERTERNHVLAHLNRLEWVFHNRELSDVGSKLLRLVSASQELYTIDPALPAADFIRGALAINDFSGTALLDVLRAQPPIGELTQLSPLSVLRWVAHRVLPYPCFLVDDTRVALHLGIAPECFSTMVEAGHFSGLSDRAEYRGVLQDFLGRRWWIRSVEEFFSSVGSTPNARRTSIQAQFKDVQVLPVKSGSVMVPIVDEALSETSAYRESSRLRQLQPPDWPYYAIPPYTDDATLANSEYLKSIAV